MSKWTKDKGAEMIRELKNRLYIVEELAIGSEVSWYQGDSHDEVYDRYLADNVLFNGYHPGLVIVRRVK